MSVVLEYAQRAKEIRERLRRPPNAVADKGINLRPRRPFPAPAPVPVAPKEPLPVIEAHVFISELPATARPIRVCDIIRVVCQHFSLTPEDIKGPSRRFDLVHARHIVVFLAFRLTNRSSPQIAREVGRSDHTSALHARRKIFAQIESDTALLDTIRIIEADILDTERR